VYVSLVLPNTPNLCECFATSGMLTWISGTLMLAAIMLSSRTFQEHLATSGVLALHLEVEFPALMLARMLISTP
jgi:hypothetical protein